MVRTNIRLFDPDFRDTIDSEIYSNITTYVALGLIQATMLVSAIDDGVDGKVLRGLLPILLYRLNFTNAPSLTTKSPSYSIRPFPM